MSKSRLYKKAFIGMAQTLSNYLPFQCDDSLLMDTKILIHKISAQSSKNMMFTFNPALPAGESGSTILTKHGPVPRMTKP